MQGGNRQGEEITVVWQVEYLAIECHREIFTTAEIHGEWGIGIAEFETDTRFTGKRPRTDR